MLLSHQSSNNNLLSLGLWVTLIELDAHRVDTVPLVRRRRVALTLEHMSQVTSAVAAHDLCPLHAECAVGVSGHRTGYSIEECRPAAARLEFVLSSVDGRIAAGASVGAGTWHVLVILAREGRLGAFLAKHAELLC